MTPEFLANCKAVQRLLWPGKGNNWFHVCVCVCVCCVCGYMHVHVYVCACLCVWFVCCVVGIMCVCMYLCLMCSVSVCVCWMGGALCVECVTVCVCVCVFMCVCVCVCGVWVCACTQWTATEYSTSSRKDACPNHAAKTPPPGDQDLPLHSNRKQRQHAPEESDVTQKAGTSAICTLSAPELHPSRPPAPISKFTRTVADLKTNCGRQFPPLHPKKQSAHTVTPEASVHKCVNWTTDLTLVLDRSLVKLKLLFHRVVSEGVPSGTEIPGGWDEGYDTQRCTVTTGMMPALRWAAMRAVLTFH